LTPPPIPLTRCLCLPLSQGGTLFYNTEAPDASLVESVFLSGKDQVSNALLGNAFGYPGREVRPGGVLSVGVCPPFSLCLDRRGGLEAPLGVCLTLLVPLVSSAVRLCVQHGPLRSTIQYTPVIDKPWRRPDAPNEPLCCICLLEYSATPADTRQVNIDRFLHSLI
jgi:hypothetical protein